MTLREIIEKNPLAAGVLAGFRPDFWLLLDRTLNETGIDDSEFNLRMAKLDDVHESPDWEKFTLGQLIYYLQHTHHFYAKLKMPQLDEMMEYIENIPNYRKIARAYRHFKARTLKHILLEDEIVFPWLRRLEAQLVNFEPQMARELLRENSSEVLCHDHKEDEDEMRELRTLTNRYRIESFFPLELKVFYTELERMEDDLKRHAQIEDHILFEKALELEKNVRKMLEQAG